MKIAQLLTWLLTAAVVCSASTPAIWSSSPLFKTGTNQLIQALLAWLVLQQSSQALTLSVFHPLSAVALPVLSSGLPKCKPRLAI